MTVAADGDLGHPDLRVDRAFAFVGRVAELGDGAAGNPLRVADHPRRQVDFDVAGQGVGLAAFAGSSLKPMVKSAWAPAWVVGERGGDRFDRVFVEFFGGARAVPDASEQRRQR